MVFDRRAREPLKSSAARHTMPHTIIGLNARVMLETSVSLITSKTHEIPASVDRLSTRPTLFRTGSAAEDLRDPRPTGRTGERLPTTVDGETAWFPIAGLVARVARLDIIDVARGFEMNELGVKRKIPYCDDRP